MSNSIDRVETSSGATHKTPKGTYMKHAAGAWFEWLHEWVKVDSGVHVKVNQLTEISGDGMNLKKLTQAVFQGLPVKYRWAKILENGDAVAGKKYEHKETLLRIGKGYDATDWQNSLIERQNVPTAADIDWSKAPEGATHYSKRFGEYYKAEDGFLLNYLADESRWIVLVDWSISALECPHFEMIKRPESIHDVARSIEVARVEEQSERTYPRDAIQIADAATRHMRDRAATYDQPQGERSMGKAVAAFNAITGRDLAEPEGWLLLQLLKDARQWSNAAYHQDSAEDCIAYAALKAEALERGK